jgi:hypothetical protein
MKQRKMIACLLTLTLLFGLVQSGAGCLKVLAEDTQTNAKATGGNALFTYEVLDETEKTCAIIEYKGSDTELVIPQNINEYTVTRIGKVMGFENLTSVAVPEGVTYVSNSAFAGCTDLTNVTLPDSLIGIGEGAFYGCSSLKEIIIPDSVRNISGSAFAYCSSLTNIKMPETMKKLGGRAFEECIQLESIVIPEGITSIQESTFSNCTSISEVTIPESVTDIGRFAFSGCTGLKSISIPESVTSIWSSDSFSGCVNLERVENPSITYIDLLGTWYDAATGKEITQITKGTAVKEYVPATEDPTSEDETQNPDDVQNTDETQNPDDVQNTDETSETVAVEEINVSNVMLDENAAFVDADGNEVSIDKIVIEKTALQQPEEEVKEAVEEIINQTAAKTQNVFYYDITPYINAAGGEKASLNGKVTIKLDYPNEKINKDYNIIVLHNAVRLNEEDVKKYDDYFTFVTDGFSPFTIIALEEEAAIPQTPVDDDDDDDDDDDSAQVQTTAAVIETVPAETLQAAAPEAVTEAVTEAAAEAQTETAVENGTQTPKTADASPIGMLLVILTASGLTAIASVMTRRRENL